MSKRFEYDILTADEFRDELDALGMLPETFARLTGQDFNNVQRWLSGKRDVSPWVGMVLWQFRHVVGSIPEARKWANEFIRIDRQNPEHGEYPFAMEDDYEQA